ncbi:response regulator [Candidatus Auribacterota bacterium]
MVRKKILIVEDEKDIVEMIEYNLQKEGYQTYSVGNGEDVLKRAKKDHVDLILLDIMLPGIDGFDVCRLIKSTEATKNIPIIIVSAKSQEADKIVGLELGADDYITKPFSVRELLARVKAVLRRRSPVIRETSFKGGGLIVDAVKHKVTVNGKEVNLTITEFKLLDFLVQNQGAVLKREKLLDAVFGYDSSVYDRTVDAHIKTLRKKLGKLRTYIETVRGAGYRFKELE